MLSKHRYSSLLFLSALLLVLSFCCVFMGFSSPVAGTQVHPIHICISDVNFNPSARSLEVTHKIFMDDLERIIGQQSGVKLSLGTPKEHPQAEKYISHYLQNHFKMQVNGKPLSISYLGREYESEAIWIYAEAQQVEQVSTVGVENTLLLDLYEDQNNFVHFKYQNQKKSLRLRHEESKGELNF